MDSFCADLVEPFCSLTRVRSPVPTWKNDVTDVGHVQVTFMGELKQEQHAVEVKKLYILSRKNDHSTVKLLCKNGSTALRIWQYCSVEMGQTSGQCTMYSKEKY